MKETVILNYRCRNCGNKFKYQYPEWKTDVYIDELPKAVGAPSSVPTDFSKALAMTHHCPIEVDNVIEYGLADYIGITIIQGK